MFVKETIFNLVFYKNYFIYFFELIKKNKRLFLSFIFYTLNFKFTSNFFSNVFFKKSTNLVFSSLKFLLVSKNNLISFVFPFFLNSMYKFVLPTNLYFYNNFVFRNKTYNNYVSFYKKLSFYKSNSQVNNSFEKSKTKLLSNLVLQPFIFKVVSLKKMFDFKQLFYF